jgi:hypothetical protein
MFCLSGQAVTRRGIAEFIFEGSFFEHAPVFEPALDDAACQEGSWSALVVRYAPQRRPVRFERNVGDELVGQEVREVVQILDRWKMAPFQQETLSRLRATVQVISIEVDRQTASGDCWEMVDAVAAFLASTLDGIVYAPDEGFFDKNLQPICSFHGKRTKSGASQAGALELPRYWIVGDRPVKAVPTVDGGMDLLAYDWETGELARSFALLEEVLFPDHEVDIVTEEEFDRKIEELRGQREE